MDKAYAAQYRRLYQAHWWWRARQRAVLSALEELAFPRDRARILDIGCGDGLFFDALARYGEPEGVEIDGSIVSNDGRWRDRIYVGGFDSSFQPDRRYALILMLDVLEHLRDPAAALAHALSLLEANGLLLITVPAFRALWTTHDDLNHHYTRYTRRSFHALTRAAGGQLEQMRYLFHWTFAAKLLVRFKESCLHAAPSPPEVPRSGINEVLYCWSCLEHALCRHVPLPFGSSLMAAVRR